VPEGAAVAGLWVGLAALRGWAQGAERYALLGLSFVAEGAGRLAATLALIALGAPGALAAVGAGAGLGTLPLLAARGRAAPAGGRAPAALQAGEGGGLALYLAGSALSAALLALPLVALRPLLPTPAFAALAAMALLGRAEAQVGAWLAQALYPRLLHAPEEGRAVLAATLLLGGGAAVAVAALAAAFMPAVLTLAFAGRYVAYLGTFRLFVFASLPVALFTLWTTDAMARGDGRAMALLATAVPLELVALLVLARHGVAAALAAEAVPVLPLAAYSLIRLGPAGPRRAPPHRRWTA
jgi:O-antigen/teichoic acid export membrane protein